MSEQDFAVGQRWVSNTEAELGLGIVAELENRRVVLSFPAVAERRTYAVNNAPLSRVKYNVGEAIESDDGLRITVSELHDLDGCIVYVGEDDDGGLQTIDEINLNSFVQFSRPLERMFAGQLDKMNAFLIRKDAIDYQHRHASSASFGLLGPRAQLLPHQFYIANEVSNRHQPRVLLADEVGLGKTIEAGLILHQQLLSGRVQRALIIVPETLVHQWLVEMLRRFNLHFSIIGQNAYEPSPDGSEVEDNPFEASQLVICSLKTLVQSERHFSDAVAAGWDTLIVDEAHHLAWTPTEVSLEYEKIERLATQVPGILLITATPEQLGLTGHFARLRLLDPDRFHDLAAFSEDESAYAEIAALVEALKAHASTISLRSDETLKSKLATRLTAELNERLSDDAEQETLRSDILNHLLDQHGTGRVLFRNRRAQISGFPSRQLHSYALSLPEQYLNERDSDIELSLTPEATHGVDWLNFDPRVQWLLDWLSDKHQLKVLLIAATRSTAEQLENHLRLRHGIRSAVFHEGLDLIQRDRAAAYFAETEDGADLLVCSEIGSEGRNFQFAHHLVLFDLPFNPDLLEQRIGRLDRIGQKHTIEIHAPYFENSPGEVLFHWYHRGLNGFEKVCSIGLSMLHQFETELRDFISLQHDDDKFDEFIDRVRAASSEVEREQNDGRNKLLEMNSCRPDSAEAIVGEISAATQALELEDFMERVFDFFGVDQQASTARSVVIHPGEQMLSESFPGLPEGGVTATYDRAEALSREDMHFLTWEHPMVTGAMDMLVNGEFGNATICTLKAPFLKPGILFLEALFVYQCPGPSSLQLQRYLSEPARRIVIDVSGKDLTEILTPERLASIAETIPKRTAQDIAKHARKHIEAMGVRAEELLAGAVDNAIQTAQARANMLLGSEISRLKSLAAVNEQIRDSEIEFIEMQLDETLNYLANTQLRLDAVRVALST
ncbi:MAG: RNA polymerase-associated protein RapA [Pseudomonadota bacterium]